MVHTRSRCHSPLTGYAGPVAQYDRMGRPALTEEGVMSDGSEPTAYQQVLESLAGGQAWVYEGPLTVRQFLRGLRLNDDLGHLDGLLEDAFGGQDSWSEYETPVRITVQRLGPTKVTIDGSVRDRQE